MLWPAQSKNVFSSQFCFVQEELHEEVLEEVMAKVKFEREKRASYSSYKDRFEQEEIPPDATVVYQRNTVTVFTDHYYKTLYFFNRITSFHSYNEFDGVSSLYDTRNKTFSFRGFGKHQ